MKNIFLTTAILFSPSAFAETCVVTSGYYNFQGKQTWAGASVSISTQSEDENGMPKHSTTDIQTFNTENSSQDLAAAKKLATRLKDQGQCTQIKRYKINDSGLF